MAKKKRTSVEKRAMLNLRILYTAVAKRLKGGCPIKSADNIAIVHSPSPSTNIFACRFPKLGRFTKL